MVSSPSFVDSITIIEKVDDDSGIIDRMTRKRLLSLDAGVSTSLRPPGPLALLTEVAIEGAPRAVVCDSEFNVLVT